MPRADARVRKAATVRLVSLDIFPMGVLAFECFFKAFKSAVVHSRRGVLAFFFFAVRTYHVSVRFNNRGGC